MHDSLSNPPGGPYVKHFKSGYFGFNKIDKIVPVPPPNECPTTNSLNLSVSRSFSIKFKKYIKQLMANKVEIVLYRD